MNFATKTNWCSLLWLKLLSFQFESKRNVMYLYLFVWCSITYLFKICLYGSYMCAYNMCVKAESVCHVCVPPKNYTKQTILQFNIGMLFLSPCVSVTQMKMETVLWLRPAAHQLKAPLAQKQSLRKTPIQTPTRHRRRVTGSPNPR